MQPEKQHISASTIYRYREVGRQQDLPKFSKFKAQNQKILQDEQILMLKKTYHHGIIGRNVNQHTVVIDKIGSTKIGQISKIVTDDQFVGYVNQRMLHITQSVLKEKQEIIWILDLAGPIMQLASKRVYAMIEKIVRNLHNYFPKLLHKLYFVNTPMLFDTIWNKLASQIDEQTQEKIIFVTDELQQLYVDVDPVILPEFLGGNCSNKVLQQLDTTNFKEQRYQQDEKQEQYEDQQINLHQLKAALSGLKIGSMGHGSITQTPLNTQADEYKKK